MSPRVQIQAKAPQMAENEPDAAERILGAVSTTPAERFEPGDMAETLKLAEWYVDSGLLPRLRVKDGSGPWKHVPMTVAQAFVLIQRGAELGMAAATALYAIDIIEMRPALKAATMRALVRRSKTCAFLRCIETTHERCTYEAARTDETARAGDPDGGVLTLSFTIQEAEMAGLIRPDSNWIKYRRAMLQARASSAICSELFPDVLLGFRSSEEAQDEALVRIEKLVHTAPVDIDRAPDKPKPAPKAPPQEPAKPDAAPRAREPGED